MINVRLGRIYTILSEKGTTPEDCGFKPCPRIAFQFVLFALITISFLLVVGVPVVTTSEASLCRLKTLD